MKYKILVVEDNNDKRASIRRTLTNAQYSVKCTETLSELITCLTHDRYDIVIIDMHIPEHFNKSPKAEGGIDAIKYIRESSDVIYKPRNIIILSQYASSENMLQKLHKRGYRYPVINYSDTDESWKIELLSEIENTVGLNGRRADIVIAVAVDVELDNVLKAHNWTAFEIFGDNIQYYHSRIKNIASNIQYSVVLCRAREMGPIAATNMVSKAINHFLPDYVFMIGIAAGKKGRVNTCDIVVAKTASDYSYGKVEDEKSNQNSSEPHMVFRNRTNTIAVDDFFISTFDRYRLDPQQAVQSIYKEETLQLAFNNNISSDNIGIADSIKKSSIVMGRIVSGPCVVKSEEYKKIFIDHAFDDYLGIDMETYSVYYAARNANHKPKFLSIKAISDMANSEKSDEYQRVCVLESFCLIKYLIAHDLPGIFIS